MTKRFLQIGALAFTVLLITAAAAPAQDEWLTPYEMSDEVATPRYQETVDFCQRLAQYSDYAEFTGFGLSPQGRMLPLLIIDKDQEFNPKGAKTKNKVVVLFQAGIHAGEIEGKDAGLMLFRDMLVDSSYQEFLDSVVVLFIPIFNVDGHERFGPYNRINQNGPREMGWRTTAQDLNLNRDFAKADSPEMRGWLAMFTDWLPDFLVDIHTTDGADYQYVITYAIETTSNVAEPLRSWTEQEFLPDVKERMEGSAFSFIPYVVPRTDHDVRSGLIHWTAGPRYSNGYGAAQNRPFLLIETHMLKPYKQRVKSVYELMRHVLGIAYRSATHIKQVMEESDDATARDLVGHYFPLQFEEDYNDSTMIDFYGTEMTREKSDISGTQRIIWTGNARQYHIPYFEHNVPTDSAMIPYAYLIPVEWGDVISRLGLHGISVDYLSEPATLPISSYRFSKVKFSPESFEGRQMVTADRTEFTEQHTYPAGTAVIRMNQRTARIAADLLEPGSSDSFFQWGFFNNILEEKEYAEDYVMEKLAREMIASDSTLKIEFDKKLKEDPEFAKSPEQRLHFFYERSPYFDSHYCVYPIGRLMSRRELPLGD